MKTFQWTLSVLAVMALITLSSCKGKAGEQAGTCCLPDTVWQNPNTEWMHKAKVGVFMHFLPYKDNFELVDQFDVVALANQLQSVGASYFVLTLGQNSGYFNAPNPVYDRIAGYEAGERTAKRDLPLELSKELEKRSIRLMLYLPCQTPNRDMQAVTRFGFPAEEENKDRNFTEEGVRNWASVIEHWSKHYGKRVSGWWFDGGYAPRGFNSDIAQVYAKAVKSGNPASIAAYNPGVEYPVRRATTAEDYTAGEINEALEVQIDGRWIDGSQAQVLTFLGDHWGDRNCRYGNEELAAWLKSVTDNGCAVTFDVGPNYDPKSAPIGSISEEQLQQLAFIIKSVK